MECDLVPNAIVTGRFIVRNNDAVFDKLLVIKWSIFIY